MKTNRSQKNRISDWKQVELGDCLERIEGGGTPSKEKAEYWNGSIPWASVKDVVTHNSKDTQDHISETGLKNSSSRLVKKGTLIVPTRMALGHAVVFDIDVAINQDLKALYPKKDLLNEYLYHWFKSKKEFIEKLGSGSTVSGIQQNELKKIKFNLPPLPEQNRIVSVLETWDKAIEKLSKKIEIKKQIKKGLMQDLLTGKKRLKGFSDKWETVEFNDFFEVLKKPEGYKTEEYLSWGEIPVIDQSKDVLISGYVNNKEKVYDFTKKPVIIFGDHSRVIKFIDMMVSFGNDGVKLFQTKNNFYVKFGYYVLLNFRIPETGYNRHFKYLDSAIFDIPKSKEEQKAIAQILTTADNEIQELEKKLQIIKDQKKYLLNNLITGTIRTPETLSTKLTK